MFDALAWLLARFYDLWPSYGGAIILFTVAIMLVLSPLSIKSTRSMIAMQRVSPEMKKLQQKHKDDKEALNREMMAFYKENNINPFSSCLPLLLQMPVFIVLYRVLNGLTKRDENGLFDPDYLDQSSSLYQALKGTREMRSFGMDLSRGALDVLQEETLLVALPFLVLVAIVVGSTFVQQRQIAGRNPDAAANPQQQMIGRIMPLIFIPISLTISAGVVVYFAVSNLVRIGQQALVTRLEFRGDAGGNGAKPKPSLPPGDATTGKPKPSLPPGDATTGKAKPQKPRPSGGAGSGPKPSSTSGAGKQNGSGAGPAKDRSNGAGGSRQNVPARHRKKKRR